MINESGSPRAAKNRLLRGMVVSLIAFAVLFTVWKIAPAAVFAADSTTTVVITGSEVNVRSGPGTNQDKLGKATKGQSFKYISQTTNSSGKLWYKIQYTSSKAGWVSADYCKLQTTANTEDSAVTVPTVFITGSEVNVRSGPGTNQDKLGKVTKGQSFKYISQTTNSSGSLWYKIQYTSSKTGWVTAEYCRLVMPTTTASTTTTKAATTTTTKATTATTAASVRTVTITGTTVNVRSNPGTSHSKVGSATNGQKFPYLASKKGDDGKTWYKIQYTSSKVGWVTSSYSKLDPLPTTTTKATTTTTTTKATTTSTDAAGATTTTKATASTVRMVTITGTTVNVRSNPGTSHSKLGSATNGQRFPYLASKKGDDGKTWYKIQYTSSKAGWVTSAYSKLDPLPTTTTTTTTTTKATIATTGSSDSSSTTSTSTTAKPTTTTTTRPPVDRTGNVLVLYNSSVVYATASVKGTKIATVNRGQFLTGIGGKKDSEGTLWYNVKVDDTKTGWISSDQSQLRVGDNANLGINTSTKRCLKRTIKVNKNSTKIYSAAKTSSTKIATLSAGKKFTTSKWQSDSSGVTWFGITYNGKSAWISSKAVTISDTFTAPEEKNYSEEGTPIIYLSPSNQTANSYAYGKTTEQKEMYRVAQELRDILESEYVCEVRIPPVSLPVTQGGRAYEAYLCGADFYLAIHSNAANKNNYGATAYYFPAGTQSKTFATNIVAEMKKIAPKKSTVTKPVVDGMTQFNKQGYSDIRNPGFYGMPSVLAEVEYHDNATTAKWIINNTKPIARALANSLEKTMGLRKR